jgi:hypothetical protein
MFINKGAFSFNWKQIKINKMINIDNKWF